MTCKIMENKILFLDNRYYNQLHKKEEIELITDRLEWSINQWGRNRKVIGHKVISEGSNNSKQMLFG